MKNIMRKVVNLSYLTTVHSLPFKTMCEELGSANTGL
jgi:hypothetical protein